MPVWAGLFFCLRCSFLGWNGSSWPEAVAWLRLSAALCLIFDVDYLSGILPEYFIKILLRLCKALFDFCVEHLEKLLSCALAGWITLSILRFGRKSACSLQDLSRRWLCCLQSWEILWDLGLQTKELVAIINLNRIQALHSFSLGRLVQSMERWTS